MMVLRLFRDLSWLPGRAKHPSLGQPLSPKASRLADDVQGGLATRGFPLFKIPLALSHLVRHVGKTDDLVLPGLCHRVEGGGLHFHRQDALCVAPRDHRFRLPKGRIGRPTGTHVQGKPLVVPP